MDNICNQVFTDKITYPDCQGQNLKVEQLHAVRPNSVHITTSDGSKPYSYTFKYPYVWVEHERSDTSKNQGALDWRNNRSKAYGLTTKTVESSESTNKPVQSTGAMRRRLGRLIALQIVVSANKLPINAYNVPVLKFTVLLSTRHL